MPRSLLSVVVFMLALALAAAGGGMATLLLSRPTAPKTPDAATVVLRIREVARLETLEVQTHKKLSFEPEPVPADGFVEQVWSWAKYAVSPPRGRAIVFARVLIGLDLDKLGPEHLLVRDDKVWVVLPPLWSRVEVLPEETEIIESSLDATQTTQLLALAARGIDADVKADASLFDKARRSSERTIAGLLYGLGFRDVSFVGVLPGGGGS